MTGSRYAFAGTGGGPAEPRIVVTHPYGARDEWSLELERGAWVVRRFGLDGEPIGAVPCSVSETFRELPEDCWPAARDAIASARSRLLERVEREVIAGQVAVVEGDAMRLAAAQREARAAHAAYDRLSMQLIFAMRRRSAVRAQDVAVAA